jgi:hypothetical protein
MCDMRQRLMGSGRPTCTGLPFPRPRGGPVPPPVASEVSPPEATAERGAPACSCSAQPGIEVDLGPRGALYLPARCVVRTRSRNSAAMCSGSASSAFHTRRSSSSVSTRSRACSLVGAFTMWQGFVSSQSRSIAKLKILRTRASVRLAAIGARSAMSSSNSRGSRLVMSLTRSDPHLVAFPFADHRPWSRK